MNRAFRAAAIGTAIATLAACGGGNSTPPPPPRPPGERTIELSWAANHERGVNSAGGGYLVSITRTAPTIAVFPAIDVPYVSGSLAPTVLTSTMYTGTYTVAVRAYAALDSAGGTAGTLSSPAQLTVAVP